MKPNNPWTLCDKIVNRGMAFRPMTVSGEPMVLCFRRGDCPLFDAARFVLPSPVYDERKQSDGHTAHFYRDRLLHWRAALIFPDGADWNILVLTTVEAKPDQP